MHVLHARALKAQKITRAQVIKKRPERSQAAQIEREGAKALHKVLLYFVK